jgi:hypothetical protein
LIYLRSLLLNGWHYTILHINIVLINRCSHSASVSFLKKDLVLLLLLLLKCSLWCIFRIHSLLIICLLLLLAWVKCKILCHGLGHLLVYGGLVHHQCIRSSINIACLGPCRIINLYIESTSFLCSLLRCCRMNLLSYYELRFIINFVSKQLFLSAYGGWSLWGLNIAWIISCINYVWLLLFVVVHHNLICMLHKLLFLLVLHRWDWTLWSLLISICLFQLTVLNWGVIDKTSTYLLKLILVFLPLILLNLLILHHILLNVLFAEIFTSRMIVLFFTNVMQLSLWVSFAVSSIGVFVSTW